MIRIEAQLRASWRIPSGGFAFMDLVLSAVEETLFAEKNPERYLVRRIDPKQDSGVQYDPISDRPALFLEFADLGPNTAERGIVDFAEKHGSLIEPVSLAPATEWGGSPHAEYWGEPLAIWRDEVSAVARALEGLEAIGLLLLGGRSVEERGTEARPPAAEEGAVQISDLATSRLAGHVELCLEHGRDGASLYPTMVARDLLGAIWLQLARAAKGDREFRRCEVCGDWFEISPETARTMRRFCTDRCRVRGYRQRRARAVELAVEGLPARQIAAEVDSDEATVAGWIGKAARQ